MQSRAELITIIQKGRPEIPLETVIKWATYLTQLDGCHLFSVAAPEKDKAEWLRERRAGIGGSEVAAIMGENHWNSPRQIWMSKMGMFDDKPPQQSEAARWGNLLETVVADEWALREGRKYVHIPVILQDDERPYLLANIDGFTLSDDGKVITGILEIKTTSAYNQSVWENGPLPFHYMCQTNWYCGITRLGAYTIVCLVGGQHLYSYDLPADSELFAREVAAADDFWLNHIVTGIEPEATAVDKELLKKAESADEVPDVDEAPTLILDDEESQRLITSYIQLRDKAKALKDIKDAVYAQIKIKIGKSPSAMTATNSVTVKKTARRSCDFDLLQSIAPEIYAQVVSENVSLSLDIR